MPDTIFTKIINKEIPADVLFENEHVIVFLDIHPNNPGHSLVVPKEPAEDLLSSSDESLLEVMKAVKKVAPVIVDEVQADGFNLIANTKPAAGQMVMHTHFHIIPRFDNDGLKHWPHAESSPEERKQIADKITKAL
jgi:histidine triad (HIT) family protein